MPVVVVLIAVLILGGVVVVATGRGGELARNRGRDALGQTDLRTWSDVASYRPPPALLGYHAATTEQALSLIARTIAERDAEIAWLRSRLAEARSAQAAGRPPAGEQLPAGEPPAEAQHATAGPAGGEPVLQGGFTAQQAPVSPAGEDG